MFHEVMNIVREGSRTSAATPRLSALVNLRDEGARLVVEFINDRAPDPNAKQPSSRSLNERAMELGVVWTWNIATTGERKSPSRSPYREARDAYD